MRPGYPARICSTAVIRLLALVRFPAIVVGCIISLRHVRAAFDNINARSGAADYRFGRMALDGEALVPGERRRGRDWVHGR
jgi:hypothetical protein